MTKDLSNPELQKQNEKLAAENKQLKQQLQDSIASTSYYENYKLLAEETQAIFWEFDILNDKWVYVAPQVENILGYSSNEWTNLKFWTDKLHPDDQKWAPGFCRRETEKGVNHIFEYRFLKKDGNYVWMLENANVKLKNGKPHKLWGYMIDITERKITEEKIKESERKFKLLADYTPNWEYWMNENREFVYISKSCEELTGYTIEEFVEKPWLIFEIVHPEDKEVFTEHIENCFDENKRFAIKEIEFRVITSEGDTIYLNQSSRPIFDEGEKRKFLGIRVSSSDITERKFAQEELKRTNEELHLANNYAHMMAKKAGEANRAKSEFLANMSHEIRTPLNGVIGFTQLLRNTELNSEQKTYVEKADISAKLLMDLIDDILDFSKIEAGKMELDEVKTDIIELTQKITDVIKYKADEKGLDFKLTINESVPRFAVVDPTRLRQVLINLLGNAVKFTDKGKVEIVAGFKKYQSGESKGRFTFSVKDTGIGISEQEQKKLFKAFVQADTSTTRKYGGTGLGLVISYKIIEKMGSALKLKSKPGEGSEFYFSIDREYEYGEPVNKKVEKKPKKQIAKEDPSVLVVEDTEMNFYLIKTLLYQILPEAIVEGAANGAEGVEKFIKTNPDIVLLDIQMPIKDGYTVAKEIREFEEENMMDRTPLIALTARAVKGEKEKCINSGMDDFLSKPINQKQLENTIAKYLSKPEESTDSDQGIPTGESPQSNINHFDKQELLKRVGGDNKVFEELLNMAMVQIPEYINNLKNTIEDSDFDKIKQAAHKLKGAAQFASFNRLGNLAGEIEYNKDKDMKAVRRAFGEIEVEFKEVRKVLSTESVVIGNR